MVRHKKRYWKCVDCSSMIDDSNMHDIECDVLSQWIMIEFCYGCMNYNPEVVIAYD